MRVDVIALMCVVGCATQQVRPQLPPPPAIALPQFLSEGAAQRNRDLVFGVNTSVSFSVAPETLAALLIVTAERGGWQVDPWATVRRSAWQVEMRHGDEGAHRVVVQGTTRGGSWVCSGEGVGCLPVALYRPLTDTVRAYFEHQLPPAAFTRR